MASVGAQEYYSEEMTVEVTDAGDVNLKGVFEGTGVLFPLVPDELPYEINQIQFINSDTTNLVVYFNADLDVELAFIMADIIAEAASEMFSTEFIHFSNATDNFVYKSSDMIDFSSYLPTASGFAQCPVFDEIYSLETKRSAAGWMNAVTLYSSIENHFSGSGEHILDVLSVLEIQSLQRNPSSVFSTLQLNFEVDDFSYTQSTPHLGKDYSSYPFPAYFNKDSATTYSLIFGDDYSSKDTVTLSFQATFPSSTGSSSADETTSTPGFEMMFVFVALMVLIGLIRKK